MKIILLACVSAILSGCLEIPQPETKAVSGKFATLIGGTHKYYINAADGSRLPVSLKEYQAIQIGDAIISHGWIK